ncbi:MAG: hypothetical protein FWB74_01585 [Defluviitaleaceae bacterium]|nr:hypothetical protein [Defluviitaleaceae bacterium]
MKFFKSKNWELIKYGVGMASKLFLAMTILNVIVSFFDGTFDADQAAIISNILTIFFCVSTVFIIERMKTKMWLRILVAYVLLMVLGNGFILAMGIMRGEVPFLENYVNNSITLTIMFAITSTIALTVEHVQEKAKKKAEEENNNSH